MRFATNISLLSLTVSLLCRLVSTNPILASGGANDRRRLMPLGKRFFYPKSSGTISGGPYGGSPPNSPPASPPTSPEPSAVAPSVVVTGVRPPASPGSPIDFDSYPSSSDIYYPDYYQQRPCSAKAPPLSSDAKNFLKCEEGVSCTQPITTPRDIGDGKMTVGWGHVCTSPGCAETGFSFPITTAQADQQLDRDLPTYETCLQSLINVPLNANQYGALVSWAFNVGCTKIGNSGPGGGPATLIQQLNAGDDANTVISQQLPRWDNGGNNMKLDNRRAAEVNMATNPTSAPGMC